MSNIKYKALDKERKQFIKFGTGFTMGYGQHLHPSYITEGGNSVYCMSIHIFMV
jgi:hypothetical protein